MGSGTLYKGFIEGPDDSLWIPYGYDELIADGPAKWWSR